MLTTEVENFPGFPDAVLGPELMERMEKQAARFEAELLHQEATRVDFSQWPFRIWSGDEEWAARSVIISTGASAKMLGLDSERRLLGHGVSTCATCDGFFFRGLELLVVGGGDSALEEAIFLTRFATKVTLIHRRDSMRASAIMQDRATRQSEDRVRVERGRRGGARRRERGRRATEGRRHRRDPGDLGRGVVRGDRPTRRTRGCTKASWS